MCRRFVNRKRTITYIFVFRSAFTWLIDSSIRPRTFCRRASSFYNNARTDIGIAAFVVITQLAHLGMVSLVIAEGSADTSKSLRGVEDQYEASSFRTMCLSSPAVRFVPERCRTLYPRAQWSRCPCFNQSRRTVCFLLQVFLPNESVV